MTRHCLTGTILLAFVVSALVPSTPSWAQTKGASVKIGDRDFVFEPAPGEACGAVLGGWILGYRHLARCCGA